MAISYNMSPEWFDKTALRDSFAVFNELSEMHKGAMGEDEKSKPTRRPATPQEYWKNALPQTRK